MDKITKNYTKENNMRISILSTSQTNEEILSGNFTFLGIVLTIISITISIIGIISVIKPILDYRRENRLKDMEKKIEDLEKTISIFNNRLFVFTDKLNFFGNINFDCLDKDYKSFNNAGVFYLKKARLTEDEKLKEYLIKDAIRCFKDAIKCFKKPEKKIQQINYLQ